MKTRLFTYILLAGLTLLSCGKQPKDTGDDNSIVFLAEEGVSSKALLTNATLKTNGNRIHVMDVLSGFTGSASWAEGDLVTGGLYINDEVEYNGAVVWAYNSGRFYPWTADGGHQFFGWLSYDSAMNLTADSYFGQTLASNFSAASRTLTLPAKEMRADTDQFDFLFANTGNYDMPRNSTDPVPLAMQHLFSAISVDLYNESQDEILVKNVTISGLKNKKSAVVSFVGTPPVAFTTLDASQEYMDNAYYSLLDNATKTLTPTDRYDLLARVKNQSPAQFRLIWPQTQAEIAAASIQVEYEYLADEEHINHTANLSFPADIAFNPGVRYAFTLLFTQKHVQLNFRVNPWIYDLNEWSYTEQSISEVTVLDFNNNPGYDKPSKTCTIIGGEPVKGTFKIVNPSGATWSIEPVGDVGYFTISPHQGTIDSQNPNYEFYVTPNLDPTLDRSTDKKLKFRFYVQFTDGTVHDANSEINYDDWTVVLPKI